MTAVTKTFTLINVYAPNKDDPEFLGKVIEYALSFACEDIFLVGILTLLDVKKGGTNTNNPLKKLKKLWPIWTELIYGEIYIRRIVFLQGDRENRKYTVD